MDDLIATGGTMEAAVKLGSVAGAKRAGCGFVIELPDLDGRERLQKLDQQVVTLC